jgi:prophage antirepressor-like protein
MFRPMFEGQRVRTVWIAGVVWFVAADVCEVLGIGNPRQAVSYLDKDQVSAVTTNDGRSQARSFNVVNESGLYQLIFRSRKPEARRFTIWVTEEILPSIRLYGCYPPPSRPPSRDRAMIAARHLMEEEVARRRAAAVALDEKELCDAVGRRLATEHPEFNIACATKLAHDIGLHRWIRGSAAELVQADPDQPNLFTHYSLRRDGIERPVTRDSMSKTEIAEQILGPRSRARNASRAGITTTLQQDRALVGWWNRTHPEESFTSEDLDLVAADLNGRCGVKGRGPMAQGGKSSIKSMALRALRACSGSAPGLEPKNANKINGAPGAPGAPGRLIAGDLANRQASRARFSTLLFSFVASTASGRLAGLARRSPVGRRPVQLLVGRSSDGRYSGSAAPVKYLWDIGDFRIWSGNSRLSEVAE